VEIPGWGMLVRKLPEKWGMLVRIPPTGWGILVRISPSRLGHAYENWRGMLVGNDISSGLHRSGSGCLLINSLIVCSLNGWYSNSYSDDVFRLLNLLSIILLRTERRSGNRS
jgi:hypothetical protein